jgi:dihydrofolate reductase
MRINLIYARAANGVIGQNNAMPWHLPEDLAHFKRHTQGCPVIMGRATWYSLPERFRPLPGRLNLVLTRDAPTAERLRAEGALPLDSLAKALAHCRQLPHTPAEVWVMGGAQVYAQAEPLAVRAVVTEIAETFEGDALAPTLGPDWHESARDSHVSQTGLRFDFVTYERHPTASL